ncbi:phosphopantetheine-binding protein [Nonomuraea sp. NPDC023979]|uniref:acyl carrier protein n=1 Tax=Nonomuraea sp. NPDC023979 TaxID=3154796 RepID=UPI00340EF5CB
MTEEFTLDQLNRIVGEDSDVLISPEQAGAAFADLGLDSLALVELAERLVDEYDVPAPEDVYRDLGTPELVLDYVNRHLGKGRQAGDEEFACT